MVLVLQGSAEERKGLRVLVAPTGRAHVLRRLMRDKVAFGAATVLAVVVLAAIFAPWVAPFDPYLTDLSKAMVPPNETTSNTSGNVSLVNFPK